jgi:hypothetical protein
MQQELLPIVRDPLKYLRTVSIAFGMWMDRDWRTRGWDSSDFSKNYFSPEEFRTGVHAALDAADQYVWIYTESPRWWAAGNPTNSVPQAYDAALRNARGR